MSGRGAPVRTRVVSRPPTTDQRPATATPPPLLDGADRQRRIEQLTQFKRETLTRILSLPNVHGVGVGHRIHEREGKVVDEPVLRIYVGRKLRSPKSLRSRNWPDLRELDWLPNGQIDIVPRRTYIQQDARAPAAAAAAADRRAVSLLGGASISAGAAPWSTGTLGLVCTDAKSGDPVALSCWHVLAAGDVSAQPGLAVVTPGAAQNGSREVAKLRHWLLGGATDAATAALDPGVENHPYLLPDNRVVQGVRDIRTSGSPNRWFKYGAGSGWTDAYLYDAHYSTAYLVGPPGRRVRVAVDGAFMLGAFRNKDGSVDEVSRAGDSGALWVDDSLNALALQLAGDRDDDHSTEYAVAAPLSGMVTGLGIRIGR